MDNVNLRYGAGSHSAHSNFLPSDGEDPPLDLSSGFFSHTEPARDLSILSVDSLDQLTRITIAICRLQTLQNIRLRIPA